jgi:cytochrome c oxidase assembly factor CtaG
VALYVAILPFTVPKDVALDEQDFTSRWVLAIGVAFAAVLFGVGVYRRTVVERGETFRWPIRRTATLLLAYAAWVFAIPASPLNSFEWYTGSIGAVVGIVATAVIALVHLWFGPPED